MTAAIRFTLFCLILIAAVGTYLRAFPFMATQPFNFEYLRHAHSHLAFLGWVFGALYLGFVHFFTEKGSFIQARFRNLFWWIQGCALAMFISFAASSYSALSIILLVVHTLLAFLFFKRLLSVWQISKSQLSYYFALTAFSCFVLSALGPLFIPVIKFGLNDSIFWKKHAVHFYLYFQYGGWFLFGILAILFRVLEKRGALISERRGRIIWGLLVIGMLPMLLLGAPSGKVSIALEYLSFFGVLLQATGLWSLLALIAPFIDKKGFKGLLMVVVFSGLLLKNLGELIASFPLTGHVFNLANPFLVVSYLHFQLLGIITVSLLWMIRSMGFSVKYPALKWIGIIVFLSALAVSELYLFSAGLNNTLPLTPEVLLHASSALLLGVLLLSFSLVSVK
jgi:hypothetical protein